MPAAPGCAPRSRHTTRARASRSISKLHPTRSHSGAAEGGINAALGNTAEDSPEKHAFDTVKGSDYLGDQDAIEIFTAEAPGDIYQLEHWGCVFSRNDEGKLAQRPFGAAGSPRTVYAADITGHVLIQVLYEQLQKRMAEGLVVFEEYFAFRLVEEDGRCTGVVCWDLMHGGVKAVPGKAVILATGGAGRLFRATTNAYACTGDGMAMALRAGLPLKDMEFMQFHPTTMYPTGILITEGCRGEGGYLINKDGERFMKRYAPNALELASRDVVSRSETTEIEAGRGRQRLGLPRPAPPRRREDPQPAARLARARDDVRRRRPDLRADPGAPGRPLPHGRRRLRQLGPHRARGPVRGRRGRLRVRARREPARRQLADGDDHVRPPRRSGGGGVRARQRRRRSTATSRPRAPMPRPGSTACSRVEQGERPWQIRDELGQSMLENFGVFRRAEKMEQQVEIIAELRERYERGVVIEDKGEVFNSDLTQAIELGYLLDLAACMLQAGIARKESRGAHSRPSDFPSRDDENFLKHSITRWRDGGPELSYAEVRMTQWEPMERTY